jgi:hypothetical protein
MYSWGRIATIREHKGMATDDEQNLRRYLSSSEYPVHEPINAYVRGMGDFEDPSGTIYILASATTRLTYDGLAGFFGQSE